MSVNVLIKCLFNDIVIPVARTLDDFNYALKHAVASSVIVLFGDINMLPSMIVQAKEYKKRVVVHLDLFEGIGKDKAGIKYLARIGVAGIITTKHQLCKVIKDEGLFVIQRVFLMDSEALKTSVHMAKNGKPDAIEVLPACVPSIVVMRLAQETKLPILAGGLLSQPQEIAQALKNGVSAVSTSNRNLWHNQ